MFECTTFFNVKLQQNTYDRIVPIPAMSYSIRRAPPRLRQPFRGQVVTDASTAPLTCFGLFFMARVLDPFSAGPAGRTEWFCPKVQFFKRKSYLVKGKLDGSVGLLARTCPLWTAFGRLPSARSQVARPKSVFLSRKSQQEWLLAGIRGEQGRPQLRAGAALHVDVPTEDRYAQVPSPQARLRLSWVSGQPGERGGAGVDGERGAGGGRGGCAKRWGKVAGRGSTAAGSCWWSLKLKGRQDGCSCAIRSSPPANLTPHSAGKSRHHVFP